jgi:flagellum-specific peptidoglycan hydrolase FlgJ
MIKKLILYILVVFVVGCGSKKNVVRTTSALTSSTKTIVRTVKKPVVKQVSNSIVKKKSTPIVKPIENKTVINKNQSDKSLVKISNESKDINESDSSVVLNQNDPQIEILDATTRVKVTTAMVVKYIEKYKEIAKKDMIEYGIPASVTLGQGILESGAGTGPLSAQANNHFGIKCHKEWIGPSVRYNDDEENECFRKYNNPDESYRDHSLFLISRAHYSSLFKLDKTDYKAWAKGLKTAGYATDPAYPSKLIAIIERYQLNKLDFDVLGKDYIASNSDYVVKSDVALKEDTTKMSSSQAHQVSKGDTLYSISRKYNITIQDLKKKNNISNDTLSVGQNLIIK